MNISFSMTKRQIRDKSKTVTRRVGWEHLVEAIARGERPVLDPIEKGQGLKKGEKITPLGGKIRVIHAWREPVNALTNGTYSPAMAKRECEREGFPDMSPRQFVKFFCKGHKCDGRKVITRIEFEYL